MTLGGGNSRSWLVDLKPDGRRPGVYDETTEVIGTHRGFYEGLNITNPRPGFAYEWAANRPPEIMRARMRGWEPVLAGDEDQPAYMAGVVADVDSDSPTPLDTGGVFQDVVCMRIREPQLAKIREEERALRERRIGRGMARQFLDGAEPDELIAAQGSRTRFAVRGHGIQVRDGNEVVAGWQTEGELNE